MTNRLARLTAAWLLTTATLIPALARQPAASRPAASQPASRPTPHTFEITFDPKICDHPYTGRVWVMTGRSATREPRFGPDWFRPSPFFAREVKNWNPGDPLVFDDSALAFPKPIGENDLDGFYAQAVMAL